MDLSISRSKGTGMVGMAEAACLEKAAEGTVEQRDEEDEEGRGGWRRRSTDQAPGQTTPKQREPGHHMTPTGVFRAPVGRHTRPTARLTFRTPRRPFPYHRFVTGLELKFNSLQTCLYSPLFCPTTG